MSHSVFSRKIVSTVLIVGIVGLSIALAGCTGSQGPAGQPGPQGLPGPAGPQGSAAPEYAAKIVVSPDIVELTAKAIVVYGSGFIPNRGVFIALQQGDKTLPLESDIANEHGAFKITVTMGTFTFYKVQPGIYTLLTESKDGPKATAPLVIQEGKK